MILITGSNGQLGQELRLVLNVGEALFVDRTTCDITNLSQLDLIVSQNKIETIINCAAYTAVDLAEKETEAAYKINSEAAANLAQVAKKYNATLIHISTDYVFDGTAHTPLTEDHQVNPISVYGKSKLEGEKKILSINPRGVIIRTSWLYSSIGKNFLNTILKYGREKELLKVVYDQVGTPTYARDLARAIVVIIPKLKNETGTVLYHYSNEGVASWYDFAQSIVEIAELKCKVIAIPSSDYSTPAKRPYYSILSKTKFKEHFNLTIPYWRESLKECMAII